MGAYACNRCGCAVHEDDFTMGSFCPMCDNALYTTRTMYRDKNIANEQGDNEDWKAGEKTTTTK